MEGAGFLLMRGALCLENLMVLKENKAWKGQFKRKHPDC
jgi:hypothetical protein